jgi:folylpolyglutamate synthase
MHGRANEKGTTLKFVSVNDSLPTSCKVLGVPVQRLNCSLALELARAFLRVKAPCHVLNDHDILQAVQTFSWPGRFEVIEEEDCHWFVDGAHNTMSLQQIAAWFAKNTNPLPRSVSSFDSFRRLDAHIPDSGTAF